jgi:hypothetical protein
MKGNLSDIEYFQFEEDFIEDNLRCIPMIVRLKLDTIGIKLPLKTWSKFNAIERIRLANDSCIAHQELLDYKDNVLTLAKKYSQEKLTLLNTDENAVWNSSDCIPDSLKEKCLQFNLHITIDQWKELSMLQRFAMVKLSKPGHESKNFKKALIEFGLFKKQI